ncbi:threonine ammonia-lyase [Oribacterium sp. WCC10]|uniref:threonine ammonia-lyase n=1 Tax=Oribacterium sp. WCC10 TaxID=1855343 RepID=UPI0008ED966C|nr:threonine ammonia-lyase [Oribacterium sp. WCC10]SFG41650.1 threonine dehydratase [Oribacterium sp. WCC10]
MNELTLDRVYQAAHVLKPVINKTELVHATRIDAGCDLYLKAENLQNTGSFKIRGAYYKISTLTDEEKAKGVVACSAGNHAQGVALAAQRAGIKSTIFLPAIAPISKVEATKSYGAEIRLIDGVYDDAYAASVEYQKESGAVFIHPFNDVDVIAGQGTIGMEICDQLADADAVVVPVGGGGLISGVSFVVKKLNPNCKVYGVQAAGAASMVGALKSKKVEALSEVHTFADGISVKCPGDVTYDMVSKYVDEVVTVTDDETAAAILTLMEKQKVVSEGAGAVSVAAVLFNKIPVKDKKVVCVVSGGNIDVNILSRVINRGLIKTGRKATLTIELLDKPGQLEEVSHIVASMGANVTKVDHNTISMDTDINGCYLTLQMETRNFEHIEAIRNKFVEEGFKLV